MLAGWKERACCCELRTEHRREPPVRSLLLREGQAHIPTDVQAANCSTTYGGLKTGALKTTDADKVMDWFGPLRTSTPRARAPDGRYVHDMYLMRVKGAGESTMPGLREGGRHHAGRRGLHDKAEKPLHSVVAPAWDLSSRGAALTPSAPRDRARPPARLRPGHRAGHPLFLDEGQRPAAYPTGAADLPSACRRARTRRRSTSAWA